MSSGTDTIRFVKYLQNPMASDALPEAPLDELSHATWGIIQGLSLPSLLQMLNMERKTCTIRVSLGRRMGFFYLRDGQIINARCRGLDGLEAVQALIGGTDPKMEIDGQLHDHTQRIDLRLEEILMHAAQLQDERSLAGPVEPASNPSEEVDAIPVSEIGKWRDVAPQQPNAKAASGTRSRTWLLVGLALAMVLSLAGWLAFPRSVEVAILSTPPGAAVSLDGQFKGMTPLRLKLPSPSQGTLSVSLPGYLLYQHALQPAERDVKVILQAVPIPVPLATPVPVETTAMPQIKAPAPKAKVKLKQEPQPRSKSDIFDQLRKPQE